VLDRKFDDGQISFYIIQRHSTMQVVKYGNMLNSTMLNLDRQQMLRQFVRGKILWQIGVSFVTILMYLNCDDKIKRVHAALVVTSG